MIYDLVDWWQENIVVRIIVTVILWVLIGVAMWFFGFFASTAAWLIWATAIGFFIAGVSLIVSPLLDV